MGAPHGIDAAALTNTELKRFWSHVAIGDGCWEWVGPIANHGYAVFYAQARRDSSHRVSYALHYGPIPGGLWVLHRCDNPRCVRPDHLFLGTALDNNADMAAKGRGRGRVGRGEENGFARLTWPKVREIRTRYEAGGISTTKLAAEYNVCPATIWNVVSYRYWVEDPAA